MYSLSWSIFELVWAFHFKWWWIGPFCYVVFFCIWAAFPWWLLSNIIIYLIGKKKRTWLHICLFSSLFCRSSSKSSLIWFLQLRRVEIWLTKSRYLFKRRKQLKNVIQLRRWWNRREPPKSKLASERTLHVRLAFGNTFQLFHPLVLVIEGHLSGNLSKMSSWVFVFGLCNSLFSCLRNWER